ncbi:RING zinc finger-containing protein [Tieghemostelium lacteum]|uniref:RING-type E3 ubiquitin transferase n=1 Tax=Tieghemostelium lacteum TaxID=361077 RepID=A0A151Z6P9_TIELA|nr:RING zinc finger-containing protein [Tieghemostelium lacteum]|eukprot:KYQ89607.1 RING zinc finger-containing protein [Tieghemostelium lacteum]
MNIQNEEEPLTCAICLEKIDNLTFLDVCFHYYCYICILQWSELNPKCPLCKSIFHSLIYQVKSNTDYKRQVISNKDNSGSNSSYRNENSRTGVRNTHFLPSSLSNTDSHAIRRSIYARGVKAIPMVPSFAFHLSPQAIDNSFSSWQKKLSPWISRELISILQSENTDILEDLVLSLLRKYQITDNIVITTLQKYLFEKTPLFLHELLCFATAPYNLQAYDRLVKYEDTKTTSINHEQQEQPPLINLIRQNSGNGTSIGHLPNIFCDMILSQYKNEQLDNLLQSIKEPNWQEIKYSTTKELESELIRLTLAKNKLKNLLD